MKHEPGGASLLIFFLSKNLGSLVESLNNHDNIILGFRSGPFIRRRDQA